jgi:hypothetical protein
MYFESCRFIISRRKGAGMPLIKNKYFTAVEESKQMSIQKWKSVIHKYRCDAAESKRSLVETASDYYFGGENRYYSYYFRRALTYGHYTTPYHCWAECETYMCGKAANRAYYFLHDYIRFICDECFKLLFKRRTRNFTRH